MTPKPSTTRSPIVTAFAALIVVAGGLSGCRGERSEAPPRQFIPDMDDSPKFRNQTRTEFFADGRMMRPRVPGTVIFGDSTDEASVHRARFLKEDALVFQGLDPALPKTAEGDPAYLNTIPSAALDAWIAEFNLRGKSLDASKDADRVAAAEDMVRRGQQRFNIYCSACHGYEGDGRGLVGTRWGSPVPSFHDAKYSDRTVKTGKDGYIFHTILHGVPDADPAKPPKMPSYADKVNTLDAWAIVSYIRALQGSRPSGSAAAVKPSVEHSLRTEVSQ